MIFRAVFWIGLVSLLTPHEPDLGLGRPGAGTSSLSPTAILSAASGLSRTDPDCGSTCAGGLVAGKMGVANVMGLFHLNANSSVTQGLADVRAQIRQDRAARSGRANAV